MEPIVEQALLYDFYGELLTEHQKEIYGDYVQYDLSPSEIALDHGITRQAAYDMIKRCNKILAGYEDKLHLIEKFLAIKEKVKKIDNLLDDYHEENAEELIVSIRRISDEIIEEL